MSVYLIRYCLELKNQPSTSIDTYNDVVILQICQYHKIMKIVSKGRIQSVEISRYVFKCSQLNIATDYEH